MRHHLNPVDVERPDVVAAQLAGGHGVEEARVLVTLLDGTELPLLLLVRRLLADGEGELGPRIVPEGSFLCRE
jgi:hypothetical protein